MQESFRGLWFALAFLTLLTDEAFSQGGVRHGLLFHHDDANRVFAIEYSGDAGLRNAELHRFAHLERVEIVYGTTLTNDDVTYLSTLLKLKALIIGQESVDAPVKIEGDMSKLKNLTGLEFLHLCKRDIEDNDLKFIASLPRLKHLELVADNSFEDNSSLTDQCANALVGAKSLEGIFIQGRAKFTDHFVAKITTGLPSLKEFDLSCPRLTDESLRLLATQSESINYLALRSGQFTDDGVRHFAAATSLRELQIDSNVLSKACLPHLAKLKQIKAIELTIATIDDEGAAILAGLQQLESLALRATEFSDKQLLMFKNHPQLERLFLQGSNLSDEVVLKLIGEIPNLKHLSVGSKNARLQGLLDDALRRRPGARD